MFHAVSWYQSIEFDQFLQAINYSSNCIAYIIILDQLFSNKYCVPLYVYSFDSFQTSRLLILKDIPLRQEVPPSFVYFSLFSRSASDLRYQGMIS